METANESLKQQFQLLQEQQQKKLLRRKQRKEEQAKEKTNLEKIEEKTFGVDDNLDLKLADPLPKGSSYVSEELVQHLNDQIRELKGENGRVYKLLSEKDFEIRALKKKKNEESSGVEGITNETAASKIVELSKKVRELTAELESEKTKSKQHRKKCHDLQQQLSNIPEEARSLMGSAVSLRSLQIEEKTDNQADIKMLQDKLNKTENKMADFRNQVSTLKQEIKVLNKVLGQEVGENVNVQSLLSGNTNWRGRAQQILMLQKKVEELKSEISRNQTENAGDLEAEMMGYSSARKRTADDKQREQLRKMEKERKETQEKAAAELKALEEDYAALKNKFDASKVRNKVLSNEVKSTKQQMQTLIQKGQHDDELIEALMVSNRGVMIYPVKLDQWDSEELIEALMKQQSQLQKMLEETTQTKKENTQKQEEKLKQLSIKTQQDTNVVEQLKAIVAEKEAKVHILEDEIKQLKLQHIQKAQMEGVSTLFKQSEHRPQSTMLSSRPTTAGDNNVDLEFTISSTTPPQSRLSERPASIVNMFGGEQTTSDPVTQSRQSVRPPSGRPASVSNAERQMIHSLQNQCQEYRTIMQATEVEREKLSELVQVLQNRHNETSQKLTNCQNELANIRKKNVMLEKQAGKARLDQGQMKSSSAMPQRRTATGGQRTTSMTNLRSARDSQIMSARDDLEFDEDEDIEKMNLDELKATLEIQRDENEALKSALQSTLSAKEEDLKLYSEMIDETKKVFIQALRQYKENVHVS